MWLSVRCDHLLGVCPSCGEAQVRPPPGHSPFARSPQGRFWWARHSEVPWASYSGTAPTTDLTRRSCARRRARVLPGEPGLSLDSLWPRVGPRRSDLCIYGAERGWWACATTVQRHQTQTPPAVVGPPSQVSMVTMVFLGCDSSNLPYGRARPASGVIAPLVTDSPGAVLVMAVGTDSSGVGAEAPHGCSRGTIVNDGRDSQLGMAVQAAVSSGRTTARDRRNTSADSAPLGVVEKTVASIPEASFRLRLVSTCKTPASCGTRCRCRRAR